MPAKTSKDYAQALGTGRHQDTMADPKLAAAMKQTGLALSVLARTALATCGLQCDTERESAGQAIGLMREIKYARVVVLDLVEALTGYSKKTPRVLPACDCRHKR
jgi:hypothetical protein